MSPQKLNPEEEFEDAYTSAFEARFRRRGLRLGYKRDRAARDVGFHLTAPGSLELSDVRVWFQLKGVHEETLGRAELDRMDSVSIGLDVDDVKKWYAAPEAVYLVVYLEALDEFVGEDIRDLVDARFADHKGSFSSKMEGLSQKTLTLQVPTGAIIDEERVTSMLRHKSMRIDGPSWRGRPLGHRFDPLRCELGYLEPAVFVALVEALLTAHDFRVERWVDTATLLQGVRDGIDEAYMCVGTMYSTYQWPFSLGVEFGVSPGSDFREEGQMLSLQGKAAILVHTRFGTHATPAPGAVELLDLVRSEGVKEILVIGNAPEALLMSSYKGLLGDLCRVPQGTASLAYSVLTAPLVFMDFQDRLRWKFVNYLWDDSNRPEVRIPPKDGSEG